MAYTHTFDIEIGDIVDSINRMFGLQCSCGEITKFEITVKA